MELKEIKIKNFRNFKDVLIYLNKKNIIIGVNNVGKSNLIFALRLLLDKDLRNYELQETDFFQKNITENIEIELTINYDINNPSDDAQKILSFMKDSITNRDNGIICIKLTLKYDFEDDTFRKWEWGSSFDTLQSLSQSFFSPIYKLFSVIWIPANANIDEIYKKEKNNFFRKYMLTNNELADPTQELNSIINNLNKNIIKLPKVQEVKQLMNDNLKKFDSEKYEVTFESEIKVKGINSQLKFFMKDKNIDADTYPISGDGIKKKVSYAFLDILKNEEEDSKIIIHLFEEPENYLFYSSHFDLAKKLLNPEHFNYVFIVTHSPLYINNNFSNDANIIKLIKKNNLIIGKSIALEIPNDFKRLANKYVQDLAVALFFDNVLLVEGYSETLLFNFILDYKNINKEDIYILKVLSVNFEPYLRILKELEIECFIKTDNDIKIINNKIEFSGFNRCITLNNIKNKNQLNKFENIEIENKNENKDFYSKKIYEEKKDIIELLNENKIWISTKDLEEDISQAIGKKRFEEVMASHIKPTTKKDITEKFRSKKWYNMAIFIEEISETDINNIINFKSFSFFKEILSND